MPFFRRVLFSSAVFFFVVALVASLKSITREKPVMSDVTNLPIIVLDPGHGGLDGGAVGLGGTLLEKDVNLEICLVLRDIFIAGGFDVVMTRESDISIHDDGVSGTKRQKTSDLRNRLAIVNAQDNPVFISVHQNIYTSQSSWGAQIFYSPNNPVSKTLAEILQNDFRDKLQPENNRKHKKAGKNLYLMYEAQCPAVLVESGFLSNPAEAQRLSGEEYRAQVAFTIYSSVMKFLGLEDQSV